MSNTPSARLPVIGLVAVLLGAAAACTSDDPITPTPQPATVTETFADTLTPNGARPHPFSTAAAGSVGATITKLEPDATVRVGISLGTWNGTVCSTVVSNDNATQATVITASASAAGRLCVRIYDAAGTLVEPTTYEITVVHP
jgi:hypothetical protein